MIPIKFWAEPFEVDEQKEIPVLFNGETIERLGNFGLEPNNPMTFTGTITLDRRDTYTIIAEIYEPHYESWTILQVALGYGEKPEVKRVEWSCTV